MSLKTVHFCDQEFCRQYMTDPAPCPLCKREYCSTHRSERTPAWTLSYSGGRNGSTDFLLLCSHCEKEYRTILKEADAQARAALKTLEAATMEELKLAHTAKALKE